VQSLNGNTAGAVLLVLMLCVIGMGLIGCCFRPPKCVRSFIYTHTTGQRNKCKSPPPKKNSTSTPHLLNHPSTQATPFPGREAGCQWPPRGLAGLACAPARRRRGTLFLIECTALISFFPTRTKHRLPWLPLFVLDDVLQDYTGSSPSSLGSGNVRFPPSHIPQQDDEQATMSVVSLSHPDIPINRPPSNTHAVDGHGEHAAPQAQAR
jgi:hypothetical protein